ncbi:MAG: hypothetical protein CSA45_06420 [Gammaproteobacteria bacterium]|nr:MAG: hypothetical protein CSA45_06420 [Gammaproteobacteria bacterium]
MRDYANYFIDRKIPEKRGVSENHDIDWWMEYFVKNMAKGLFIVLLAVIFLLLKSFWQLGKSQSVFPVANIELSGNVLITRPVDVQKVLADLNDGGFFNIDLNRLSEHLQALAWIDEATVTRHWPQTLQVTLHERQPKYRWGENELLDSVGNRFANTNPLLFSSLPQLVGVPGREAEVIYAYQQLLQALGEQAETLDIKSFVLNAYLSWELHLHNGLVVKFGRDAYQQRMRRFAQAYQAHKLPDFAQVNALDFRYQGGFSVQWKPQFAPQSEANQRLVKVGQTRI